MVLSVLLLLATLATSPLHAQEPTERWGWTWRRVPPRLATEVERRDRFFSFGRVLYESVRREPMGQGWRTDYPDADINLMRRFGELTTAAVSVDSAGAFNHVVVRLTDPELFQYPFIFMSDVGTAGFSDAEATRLRDYLLRGGFLYVDDFWGEAAWEHWAREIGRVLPTGQYPIFDIPLEHPLFHAVFDVPEIPQIPNIQFWRRTAGQVTSERGAESAQPHLRAIADRSGRLLVVMSHDTDIADGWEREAEEYEFFDRFSPDAYALAINILVYAMTH